MLRARASARCALVAEKIFFFTNRISKRGARSGGVLGREEGRDVEGVPLARERERVRGRVGVGKASSSGSRRAAD